MPAIHIDDLGSPRLPFALRALNSARPIVTRFVSLDLDDLLAAASNPHGPARLRRGVVPRAARRAARGIRARGAALRAGPDRRARPRAPAAREPAAHRGLFRRHPEIENERILRPIIIAGLPRTGTTHLHNLISQDPSLRSLPYWESLEPAPDPREKRDDGAIARRCEKAVARSTA
jgi:hypothetical protein